MKKKTNTIINKSKINNYFTNSEYLSKNIDLEDIKNMDNNKIRELLIKKGILNKFQTCPKCNNTFHQFIRNISNKKVKYFRCKKCKIEYSERKNSILEKSKLSYKNFLEILFNYYSYKENIYNIGKSLNLDRAAISNLLKKVRKCFFNYFNQGIDNEADLLKNAAYGYKINNSGKVEIEILRNFNIHEMVNKKTKIKKQNKLIYTDKYNDYEGIIFYRKKQRQIIESLLKTKLSGRFKVSLDNEPKWNKLKNIIFSRKHIKEDDFHLILFESLFFIDKIIISIELMFDIIGNNFKI